MEKKVDGRCKKDNALAIMRDFINMLIKQNIKSFTLNNVRTYYYNITNYNNCESSINGIMCKLLSLGYIAHITTVHGKKIKGMYRVGKPIAKDETLGSITRQYNEYRKIKRDEEN